MFKYLTLTDVIKDKVNQNHTGVTFIDSANQEHFLSYKELYEAALNALSFLQIKGLKPKDELVFQTEDNKSFVITFWACLLGGIIPVPVSVGQTDDHKQKLFNIWKVLNNPYLFISSKSLKAIKDFAGVNALSKYYVEMAIKHVDEDILFLKAGVPEVYQANPKDIAFVQFSSGSTGSPKGVMLTHQNLIANIEAIGAAGQYNEGDSLMSWMPLTHDMGLIGFHLSPLYHNVQQYLIPTSLFIRRPALWLDKASEHKLSVLCSPNFGYHYILKHCTAKQQADWDFSRVRLIYNGAEPISLKLCYEFNAFLEPFGLRNVAMCPVYGLAEASLAVTTSGLTNEIDWVTLDRKQVSCLDTISITTGADSDAIDFVNVGKPVDHCAVAILDNDGNHLPANTVGGVTIKGVNVTQGYYNNPAATSALYANDGWLKTGDLGFIKDGDLYITGRIKDIIFVNGHNFYPHDIERVAEQVEGISLNKVAVVGSYNHETGKDEIVAFVFHRGSLNDFATTANRLKEIVNLNIGLEVDKVIPVKDIPRTTSGKLQRFKLSERYQAGEFRQIEEELNNIEAANFVNDNIFELPQNDTEQRLLNLWKKALKTDRVGTTDNFFSTGGNSLKAAELTMYIQKEFRVELPVAALYQTPTVRQLADSISSFKEQAYAPIPNADKQKYYALSPSQKAIYYQWEVDQQSVAYNMPTALQLSGKLDVVRLEDCIRILLQQHEAFRSVFLMRDEPVFSVKEDVAFTLKTEYIDDSELDERLRAQIQPFDLKAAPLFKSTVFVTNSGKTFLFIDFHHIISDGVSVHNFLYELQLVYTGKTNELAPIQYSDYACWANQNATPENLKDQELYWANKLKDNVPVLELPADFKRPAVFNTKGSKINFIINETITQNLQQLARQNNVSMHVLLLSIYNLFLLKSTGHKRVVTGIPVAGRQHPDLFQLQGMFVNNLTVIADFDAENSFVAFLQAAQDDLDLSLQNQQYPFDNMLSLLGKQRDVSRNPLFDTMFVYQNMGIPEVEGCEFGFTKHFFDPGSAKYDLSMEVFEHPKSIEYNFEYATSLFNEQTIIKLSSQLHNLVQNIIANPHAKLKNLSCLNAEDYKNYIEEFNDSKLSYPNNTTIHELFEEQVVRSPLNIALEYGDIQITYKELDDKANELAKLLSSQGVRPDNTVGILLPHSPELLVAILGVLKAGGAYLPIDVSLPEERINYLLTDSRTQIVITDVNHQQLLITAQNTAREWPLVIIDVDNYEPLNTQNDHLVVKPTARNLAYVIYTSGTTGTPKGVMIEHRSLINYICWAAHTYLKDNAGAFALYSSVSFDLTVTSIFTPLITGNKIVIYQDNNKEILIERVITDNKTDVVKLTPSHLKIINESKVIASGNQYKVRTFIVGGEQLETLLAEEICDKFNHNVTIYNEYGPTEATVGCMIYEFKPGETSVHVPIGVPAANMQIYVLDKYMNPVPINVTGEMFISGDGLARGYLYKEDITNEKFIPNPFIEGTRMYKTGDIAKRLLCEQLQYVGRFDQQVKLNGYRIELAEIENQLMKHAAIADALAVVKINKTGQNLLCVYYTGTVTDTNDLRRFMAKYLPYYMVPGYYIHLQQIPLTGNGKVNYNALPDIDTELTTKPKVQPKNYVEEVFLMVWADVLKMTDIHVDDNFFELGGDSIKAIQIASRLSEHGVEIKAKDILRYHTIAQVSLYATSNLGKSSYDQGIIEGNKLKTPIEKWFFNQHFSKPGYYMQSVSLNLNKEVNIKNMEKAFSMLIAHHDGLRMNYNSVKQQLFINNDHLEADFKITKQTIKSENGQCNAGADLCYYNIKARLDLSKDLLLKAVIIKNDNLENCYETLFITMHHLLVDGVSWRILLEDLYNIYNTLENSRELQLPLKTASVIDYAEAQHNYTKDLKATDAESKYWQAIIDLGFKLPLDQPTTDWRILNQAIAAETLGHEETTFLIREANYTYKTNVAILLNTALATALSNWTGLNTFVIEQENKGRHLENVNSTRTVGWFTTMYPLVLNLADTDIASRIKAVKEQFRNVPNDGAGYGIYKYDSQNYIQPKISQVRFNYLGEFNEAFDNDLFSFTRQDTGFESDPENHLTAVLEFNCLVIDSKFRVEIQYNKLSYRKETIDSLKKSFISELQLILCHIKNEKEIHFTASDFDMAGLSNEDLDVLF